MTMDADIIGRSGPLVGVEVVDGNGYHHEISIDDAAGEVSVHSTDAYPADLDARTPEQTERLRQAQRFAKYTIGHEVDREFLPLRESPTSLEATRTAIEAGDEAAFEGTFGEYRRQLASHHGEADPPVALPDDVTGAAVCYRLDVHLDGELETVESVSEVGVAYRDRRGVERRLRGGIDRGRPADARLELQPFDVEPAAVADPAAFREAVDHHLACQIRDSYVGMGLDPPTDYHVTGPGIHAYTKRYETLDCYPPYHDETAGVFED